MCGIVGFAVNKKNIIPDVLQSLHHLEYRGYDSVGVSFLQNGKIFTRKVAGRISTLENEFRDNPTSHLAIAHTRWSTHGISTKENAHPHHIGNVSVVHNGIIENYLEIKQELQSSGCVFQSQTDTETISHFLNNQFKIGITPLQAIQNVLAKFHGKYAVAFVIEGSDKVYAFRSSGSPIIFGILDDGYIIASDRGTLSHHTNRFITFNDYEILQFSSSSYQFFNKLGHKIEKQITERQIKRQEITKNGFETFMMKEIYEQSAVVQTILKNFVHNQSISIPVNFQDYSHIHIVACGTSFFSGSFAKYIIEEYQSIPVSVEIASEFSQRKQPFLPQTLFIFASQSGETADSIAAMEHTTIHKTPCSKILSILNNTESTMAQKSDFIIPCYAGVEIGVASTKNFVAQLTIFYLLAFQKTQFESQLVHELQLIPQAIANILSDLKIESSIKSVAEKIIKASKVVFTGRTLLFPIASEGALKLLELSYILVQTIASGEFKHGPIAIVDSNTVLVSLVHSKNMFKKTLLSNEEVISRGGNVCLITDTPTHNINEIVVPQSQDFPLTYPILTTVIVQLLAYFTAESLGNDIDKPRNLAKSVTVE